jgi:hypothetical protein
MSTKNHKATTTSDILPGAPATNPQTHKSANLFALRARCGKVARLPKEIRDQLNEMLLDGVPHAKIIQNLRDKFDTQPVSDSNVVPLAPTDAPSSADAPTTPTPDSANHESRPQNPSEIENQNDSTSLVSKIENLTPHHITTWKQHGGYRDWLRDRERIEQCKIRHELTLDLARNAEGLASYQAAPKVAVAQICQTIIDLGPDGLKDAIKDSPLNCFRLLNALARLVNSGLKCEHHIVKHAAETRPKPRNGFTPGVVEQMETALNLM